MPFKKKLPGTAGMIQDQERQYRAYQKKQKEAGVVRKKRVPTIGKKPATAHGLTHDDVERGSHGIAHCYKGREMAGCDKNTKHERGGHDFRGPHGMGHDFASGDDHHGHGVSSGWLQKRVAGAKASPSRLKKFEGAMQRRQESAYMGDKTGRRNTKVRDKAIIAGGAARTRLSAEGKRPTTRGKRAVQSGNKRALKAIKGR